jgi:hypothetical protein
MGAIYNTITNLNEYLSLAFNEAYTMPPTSAGTRSTTVANGFANEQTAPVFESSNGPITSEGSWRFQTLGGVKNTRIKHQVASNLQSLVASDNYTVGFWIKMNSVFTTAGGGFSVGIHRALTTETTTNSNYTISAVYLDYADPNAYGIGLTNIPDGLQIVTTDQNGNQIVKDKWYYVALRTTTVNVGGSLTRTQKFYINGTLKLTNTNTSFTSGSITTLNWGFVSAGAGTADVNIADWFIGDANNILETDIQGIWIESQINSATVTSSAITASGLMTEPTIAVIAGDHAEVTTSITASATFPSSISVQGNQNINNQISGTLDASTTIGYNVIINAGLNSSFSATQMTASGLFVDPIMARASLTATALMSNALVSVTPNYYSFIKSKNPVVYIPAGTEFPSWSTTTESYGSWTPITVSRSGTSTQPSLAPMSLVGAGDSSNLLHSSPNPRIYGTFDQSLINNLITSRSYTIEYWTYMSGSFTNYSDLIAKFNMKNLEIDYLGWYYGSPGPGLTNTFIERKSMTVKFGTASAIEISGTNIIKRNGWNHIVLRVTPEVSGAQSYYMFVNGSVIGSGTIMPTFNTTVNNTITWERNEEGSYPNSDVPTAKLDEMAIYDYPLSNSEIIANYNFINNLDSNKIIAADPMLATQTQTNHSFFAITNNNIAVTQISVSSLFVNPTIIAGRTINFTADPLIASATNTDATAYWGRTYYATPMISSAESKEGFVLNDIYYNYVQTNITPYRYVTFDAADTSFDYGTDNDYSVVPTTVGGTIVNPDLGINGKSAKTAGLSYITDGVILKESEWNDSWSTGANSYHSAFWFQRATDDNSTTGLRVLWNLNGYKDNQHVVIYQYQGKIHTQFNNGSGTWVEQDTGTLDLFDYERHFIVIEFNHTNPNNNVVKLYVDAVLKSTINLGAYTGTTTNAATADSGPNDEANNRPRLSVGCLITPFTSTALPVVPTNTKLIIDEIYWDKNTITQTAVTNLFNIMPNKFNVNKVAEPMLASDEFVMPTFITSVNFVTVPLTASATAVQPIIAADRQVVYSANAMTATGLMTNATVNENRTLVSDIMLASATFNNPGVKVTIPGGPMLASAYIANRATAPTNTPLSEGIKINGYTTWTRIQPWATWLRATDSNTIIPTKEVV